MIKVVCFFDYIDFDDDVESMKLCMTNFYAEHHKKYTLVFCKTIEEFKDKLSPNCIAIVDYGAISFGHGDIFDSYNRDMRKIIENHRSVTFVFRINMGRHLYDMEDLFEEYGNVKEISITASLKEWNNLFLEHHNE